MPIYGLPKSFSDIKEFGCNQVLSSRKFAQRCKSTSDSFVELANMMYNSY